MKFELYVEAPSFVRDVKALKKKFPQITPEVLDLLDDVADNPHAGDSIPGFQNIVFKIRSAVKCANISKRKGLRLIYLLIEEKRLVVPLLLYHKGEKVDAPPGEINDSIGKLPSF